MREGEEEERCGVKRKGGKERLVTGHSKGGGSKAEMKNEFFPEKERFKRKHDAHTQPLSAGRKPLCRQHTHAPTILLPACLPANTYPEGKDEEGRGCVCMFLRVSSPCCYGKDVGCLVVVARASPRPRRSYASVCFGIEGGGRMMSAQGHDDL